MGDAAGRYEFVAAAGQGDGVWEHAGPATVDLYAADDALAEAEREIARARDRISRAAARVTPAARPPHPEAPRVSA